MSSVCSAKGALLTASALLTRKCSLAVSPPGVHLIRSQLPRRNPHCASPLSQPPLASGHETMTHCNPSAAELLPSSLSSAVALTLLAPLPHLPFDDATDSSGSISRRSASPVRLSSVLDSHLLQILPHVRLRQVDHSWQAPPADLFLRQWSSHPPSGSASHRPLAMSRPLLPSRSSLPLSSIRYPPPSLSTSCSSSSPAAS